MHQAHRLPVHCCTGQAAGCGRAGSASCPPSPPTASAATATTSSRAAVMCHPVAYRGAPSARRGSGGRQQPAAPLRHLRSLPLLQPLVAAPLLPARLLATPHTTLGLPCSRQPTSSCRQISSSRRCLRLPSPQLPGRCPSSTRRPTSDQACCQSPPSRRRRGSRSSSCPRRAHSSC